MRISDRDDIFSADKKVDDGGVGGCLLAVGDAGGDGGDGYACDDDDDSDNDANDDDNGDDDNLEFQFCPSQ